MGTMLAFKSDYWLRLKPAFQLAPYSPPTACRSKKTGRSNPSLMPGSKNQTGSEVIERSLRTTEQLAWRGMECQPLDRMAMPLSSCQHVTWRKNAHVSEILLTCQGCLVFFCRNAAWDVDGVTRDCNTIPAPAQPLAREALVRINGYVGKCVYLSEIHLFWCSTVQRSSSNSEKVWSCPFRISCVWVSFKLKQRDLGHILNLCVHEKMRCTMLFLTTSRVPWRSDISFFKSNQNAFGSPFGSPSHGAIGRAKRLLEAKLLHLPLTCRSHTARKPLKATESQCKPRRSAFNLEMRGLREFWSSWKERLIDGLNTSCLEMHTCSVVGVMVGSWRKSRPVHWRTFSQALASSVIQMSLKMAPRRLPEATASCRTSTLGESRQDWIHLSPSFILLFVNEKAPKHQKNNWKKIKIRFNFKK